MLEVHKLMNSSRLRLLTSRKAAEYLGISLTTLNRVEKEGLIVPLRTYGGHRRYTFNMLDKYLEKIQKMWIEKG